MWAQDVERREGSNRYEPLVMIEAGRVIVGLQGMVTCFDRSGIQLWKVLTGTGAMGVTGRVVEHR